jgi:hypothetical protein
VNVTHDEAVHPQPLHAISPDDRLRSARVDVPLEAAVEEEDREIGVRTPLESLQRVRAGPQCGVRRYSPHGHTDAVEIEKLRVDGVMSDG